MTKYVCLLAAKVVMEEDLGERSLRKKTSFLVGGLPETGRKPRKQLTPEELEERMRKVYTRSCYDLLIILMVIL